MKNLKKVLAVVLAVAMAFSLMAVASAKQIGDYSDTSDVKYKEAVDLISGLGIMTGTSETTFDPKGTFTREQAAKVICILLVGKTVADSLQATTKTFDDVEVTRWSAPFIEYCAVNGIINGTGDGKFSPAAPVTGSAFAKMLLTALGYGAKGEYVGANWELNTLVKAQGLLILDTGVNYSAPATREEVAKYAFNALTKCKPVTYNTVTGTYSNTYTFTKAGGIEDDDKNVLGYATFKLWKEPFNLSYYGAKAHYWRAYVTTAPQTVSGYYSDDNVLFTATGRPYNLENATTANSGYYKVPLEGAYTKYYLNGVQLTDNATNTAREQAEFYSQQTGVIVKYIDNSTMGATGATTTDIPNGLAEIVYITKMSVSKMNKAPAVDASGNITMSAAGLAPTYAKVDITYPDGIAANDYFTYVAWANGKTHIEKATKVTGQITSANPIISLVNFAGQTYFCVGTTAPYGISGASIIDLGNSANYNRDATGWVDSNGFLIYLNTDVRASYNVGLVVGYSPTGVAGFGFSAKVRLYTNDGKVAIYDVAPATTTDATHTASYPNGRVAGEVPDQTGAFANATLVTYTFNANNQVKVEVAGTRSTVGGTGYAAKSSYVPIGSASVFTNYFINSSTKVLYFNTSDAYNPPSNVGTVLTGPGGTKAVGEGVTVWYITDPDNTSLLTAVFFEVAGPAGMSGNYAYLTGATYTLRTVNGVNYYDYSVYKNGSDKAETVTATSDIWNFMTDKGLYAYDVDANGYVVNPQAQQRPTSGVTWKVTYADSSMIGYQDTSGVNYSIPVDTNTKYFQVNPKTSSLQAATSIPASTAGMNVFITDYVLNTNAPGSPVLYIYYVVS